VPRLLFGDRLWNRGAVHRDEWTTGARPLAMERCGRTLLASAGLAAHVEHRSELRGPGDLVEQ